jgi:hypothetical protein
MKLYQALILASLSATSFASFAAEDSHANHTASEQTQAPVVVSTSDASATTSSAPASSDTPASAESAAPVAQ